MIKPARPRKRRNAGPRRRYSSPLRSNPSQKPAPAQNRNATATKPLVMSSRVKSGLRRQSGPRQALTTWASTIPSTARPRSTSMNTSRCDRLPLTFATPSFLLGRPPPGAVSFRYRFPLSLEKR